MNEEMQDCQSTDEFFPPQKLGIIDRVLEKAISRKLIVFLTATGLMAWSDLDPDTWGLVAIVYVGGQSVIDAVKTYKYGG